MNRAMQFNVDNVAIASCIKRGRRMVRHSDSLGILYFSVKNVIYIRLFASGDDCIC